MSPSLSSLHFCALVANVAIQRLPCFFLKPADYQVTFRGLKDLEKVLKVYFELYRLANSFET